MKTTKYGANTQFDLTANEVARSQQDQDIYYLYRLFGFVESNGVGSFWSVKGDLNKGLKLTPSSYKASPRDSEPV